jgi:hypothetical protein
VGDLVPPQADAIQFNVGLGGLLFGDGIDIPLDIDIPGFAFNIDGGLAIELSWYFDFGFGLSLTDGFYLTTNSGDRPELGLSVAAYLDGTPKDRNSRVPFSGKGRLLVFEATITDKDQYPELDGFQGSGLYGNLSLNYSGNERNRLNFDRIISTPFEELISVDLSVDATVKLELVLAFADGANLPKLKADFVLNWGWDADNGLKPLQVSLHRGLPKAYWRVATRYPRTSATNC